MQCTIDEEVIAYNIGVSSRWIRKVLNELADNGLIAYEKGNRRVTKPTITVLRFPTKNEVQNYANNRKEGKTERKKKKSLPPHHLLEKEINKEKEGRKDNISDGDEKNQQKTAMKNPTTQGMKVSDYIRQVIQNQQGTQWCELMKMKYSIRNWEAAIETFTEHCILNAKEDDILEMSEAQLKRYIHQSAKYWVNEECRKHREVAAVVHYKDGKRYVLQDGYDIPLPDNAPEQPSPMHVWQFNAWMPKYRN